MAKFYTPTKLSENIRETPEGYLLCLSVPIARTGWQDYGEGETPLEAVDGMVRIYRDAKEVFRDKTIASFEGKSLTIKHPRDFVNPQNWKELTKGLVQNVRRGNEKDEDGEESLLADILVTDAVAIQLVKNGLREVSCGYEAEYEQAGKGKGAQTNIVGNHLALVDEGRAGSSYAITDEKGKVTMSKKLAEKIKGLLGKVVDEAVEAEGKPLVKAPDKAKDEEKESKDMSKSEGMTVMDKEMYDELVKAVADLGEKVAAMSKGKDEEMEKKDDKAKDDDEEKDDKAKDDDMEGEGKAEKADDDDDEEKEEAKDKEENEAEGEILERVKALEAAVAKMLESKDDSEESEDDEELSGAEGGEGEEAEGSQKKTGDSKKKGTGLEKTKAVDSKTFDQFDAKVEEMTADKMNELNAAHWARK